MDEIDEVMHRLGYQIREVYGDGERRVVPDEALLGQFERTVGYLLPADYAYFLKQYGGAVVTNVVVRTALQHRHLRAVEGLHMNLYVLGFFDEVGPTQEIRSSYEAEKEGLPAGVVPIIEMIDGGYYFCISCVEGSYGQVFVKCPTDFEDDDPADFLFFQAPSLIDFLRSLRTLTDAQAEEYYRNPERTWVYTFVPED